MSLAVNRSSEPIKPPPQIKNNSLGFSVPGGWLRPARGPTFPSRLLSRVTAKWNPFRAPRAASSVPAGTVRSSPGAARLGHGSAARPYERGAAPRDQTDSFPSPSCQAPAGFFLASEGTGVLGFSLSLSPAPLSAVPARQCRHGLPGSASHPSSRRN